MSCLGRQGLAGDPGRALRLAPPALGAGPQVQEPLPGEVLDLPDPEHVRVRVSLLEVQHLPVAPHRLQRAERVRAPGERDVEPGQEDVHVLGVGHHDQERHDHAKLGQDEHDLEDRVDPVAEGVQGLADGQDANGQAPSRE